MSGGIEQTWNESTNHIPVGLYFDLNDPAIGIEPASACNQVVSTPTCTTMTDSVVGFTINQMFSTLQPYTYTLDTYRTDLINGFLGTTTNTTSQVDNLFSQYGY